MIRLTIGALAAALLTTSTPFANNFDAPAVDAAVLGPPWISIEHPVNPYDATTLDAFLLVHAFHHGTPMNFPVSGTAEGMVDGQRKTVNLQFTTTSRAGVFALKRQWEEKGEWTLVVSVAQGPEDKVSAVVDLARGGGSVANVRVPTRMQGTYRVPAAVSMTDIDNALRGRAGQVTSRR